MCGPAEHVQYTAPHCGLPCEGIKPHEGAVCRRFWENPPRAPSSRARSSNHYSAPTAMDRAVDVFMPAWLVQPAVFLLATAAWHWLASYGGRRLSAADSRRRLDAGGRVALRELPVPVLGRGILIGGGAWAIMLWRVAVGVVVLISMAGVLGREEGRFTEVEAVRYGRGEGSTETLSLKRMMAESVMRLCRRNEGKRSVFYELYDPGNVLVPLQESDKKPGIVGRGFCAEPGNTKEEAEMYDVQVDTASVEVPGGGETFSGLGNPTKGTVREGGKKLEALVWGRAEKQTDKGSLVCPAGADARCLWLGDANGNNERALVAVSGVNDSTDASDVTVQKGDFTYLVVNMERMRTGFLPRALLYLIAMNEQDTALSATPRDVDAVAAAETLQLLVIMDLVAATTGATVQRRRGSRATTRVEPWALAALALLALFSILQALVLCLPGHRSAPVGEYRFAVDELARCSEGKHRSSRVEKTTDDWHISEGQGGMRLLAPRESGCDRRSFVSVRTDG